MTKLSPFYRQKFLAVLLLCISSATVFAAVKTVTDPPGTFLLKPADVERLFLSKEGDRIELNFYDSENKSTLFSGAVNRHLNPGTDSGVLNILLDNGSYQYKMLISRKALNGQLIYKIQLIEPKSDTWYALDPAITDGWYHLIRKEQKTIVTD